MLHYISGREHNLPTIGRLHKDFIADKAEETQRVEDAIGDAKRRASSKGVFTNFRRTGMRRRIRTATNSRSANKLVARLKQEGF